VLFDINFMRFLIRILPVIFSFVLISSTSTTQATHLGGGQISYEWAGGNVYNVQLVFYRDCKGIGMGNSIPIQVSDSCSKSRTETLTRDFKEEIPVLCPSDSTSCQGGQYSYPGFERVIYSGVVSLAPNCGEYVISFQTCCRNGITNLNHSNNESYYIETVINPDNIPANNSPKFNAFPALFVTDSALHNLNLGAIDPDGDSLVYSLVQPKNSPNDTVPYASGLSPSKPIYSTTPIAFDSSTGELEVTPVGPATYTIAVKVEEYRNDELIGSVIRDYTLDVIQTEANRIPNIYHPSPTPVSGQKTFTINACAGDSITFPIHTDGPDQDDSTHLSMINYSGWNELANHGATFTTSYGVDSTAEGLFTWSIDSSNVRYRPYSFSLVVEDKNCGANGYQVFQYQIFVRCPYPNQSGPLTAHAGSDTSICISGTPVKLGEEPYAKGGTPPYTFDWALSPSYQTGQNFVTNSAVTYTQPDSGINRYILKVTDANAQVVCDTVQIVADVTTALSFNQDKVYCAWDTISLEGMTNKNTQAWWYNSDSSFVTNTSQVEVSPSKQTTYIFASQGANNCVARDSVTLMPDSAKCCPQDVDLRLNNSSISSSALCLDTVSFALGGGHVQLEGGVWPSPDTIVNEYWIKLTPPGVQHDTLPFLTRLPHTMQKIPFSQQTLMFTYSWLTMVASIRIH